MITVMEVTLCSSNDKKIIKVPETIKNLIVLNDNKLRRSRTRPKARQCQIGTCMAVSITQHQSMREYALEGLNYPSVQR